jgi:hypothetical protein
MQSITVDGDIALIRGTLPSRRAVRLHNFAATAARTRRLPFMTKAQRACVGAVAGAALAFGSFLPIFAALGLGWGAAALVAGVAAVVAGVYGALAWGLRIYGTGPAALLGFLLDTTWSCLNTLAGLVVWLPACKVVGGTLRVTDDSRRSGAFVYDRNPRDPNGAVFGATTIGTVIAGGWSSHEEVHVWQARLFGPAYLVTYGLAFLLGALSRLVVGRPSNLMFEAYHRICWEDWAYWAGKTSGTGISVGGWIGGFASSTLFVGLAVLVPVGIAVGAWFLWVAGAFGLLAYSIIRSLTPGSSS